jgi:hypothetical protein
MNTSAVHDIPGLDGPDYVTLVIEWDDEAEVTAVSALPLEPPAPVSRTLVAIVGALAALVFAAWGLRRLRTAA